MVVAVVACLGLWCIGATSRRFDFVQAVVSFESIAAHAPASLRVTDTVALIFSLAARPALGHDVATFSRPTGLAEALAITAFPASTAVVRASLHGAVDAPEICVARTLVLISVVGTHGAFTVTGAR